MNKVPEQKGEGEQAADRENQADEALRVIRRAGFGSSLLDTVDRLELGTTFEALQAIAAKVRTPRGYDAEPSHIFHAEMPAGDKRP